MYKILTGWVGHNPKCFDEESNEDSFNVLLSKMAGAIVRNTIAPGREHLKIYRHLISYLVLRERHLLDVFLRFDGFLMC